MFEVHGTKDHTSEWTGDLSNQGGWGAYMPVPVAVNYWVAKNRCLEEKTDTLPVKNNANGHYVITHKFINGVHDEFGPNSGEHNSAKTLIFESKDKGKSWRKICQIDGQFWSNLFQIKGDLYIMGMSKNHAIGSS